MRQFIKTATIALSIGGCFAVTLPALAANPTSEIVTTTIDQRDLATDYGVERVYKTLSHKAEISCETPGRVPVSIKRYEKLCTQDLLEDFVFDIGNESLTRYHENRIQ